MQYLDRLKNTSDCVSQTFRVYTPLSCPLISAANSLITNCCTHPWEVFSPPQPAGGVNSTVWETQTQIINTSESSPQLSLIGMALCWYKCCPSGEIRNGPFATLRTSQQGLALTQPQPKELHFACQTTSCHFNLDAEYY